MNAELADLKRAFTEGEVDRADTIEVLKEDFDMTEEDAIALIDTWTEDLDDAP